MKTKQELEAGCTHQHVIYRPNGGNAMGWADCWVCEVCSKEFVPEAYLRHMRDTASAVIDALSHQGDANFKKAWDELCFLCGRHCEPYLGVLPVSTKIQHALGNGQDEDAWHPGEHWVDAAVRAIEAYRKGGA